jgi:hypothetical protein
MGATGRGIPYMYLIVFGNLLIYVCRKRFGGEVNRMACQVKTETG